MSNISKIFANRRVIVQNPHETVNSYIKNMVNLYIEYKLSIAFQIQTAYTIGGAEKYAAPPSVKGVFCYG